VQAGARLHGEGGRGDSQTRRSGAEDVLWTGLCCAVEEHAPKTFHQLQAEVVKVSRSGSGNGTTPHLLPGPGPRRGLAVFDHALLLPLHRPLHDAVPGHGRRGGALPPGHLRVREENTGPVDVVRGVQSRAGKR
jgi:hypothetical protein